MKVAFESIVSIYHPEAAATETHTHKFHEMVYCADGQGTAEINSHTGSFCTGNYYIAHAGTHHSEHNFRACRIYFFSFAAPEEYVPEGIFTDHNGTILSLVKRLFRESLENQLNKKDMQNSLLTQILIEARRTSVFDSSKQSLSSVLLYINENLEHDIDFHQMAAKQNYSYDRFRHIFKEHTGCSPYQYLLNARLEKARILLEQNPSLSLTQISSTCGFSSSSQFSNIFRAKTGVTPSEYKHMNKQQIEAPACALTDG